MTQNRCLQVGIEMILLIDDTRNIDADIICRNYNSAIEVLSQNIKFTKIMLDHDLSSFNDLGIEKTGYDIACYLEQKYYATHIDDLPILECVSANPVGRKRIELVFQLIKDNCSRW